MAVAYEALPDATRAEIRALFAQLCRDDTPMVRRAASANLAKLAAAMFEAGEQASLKQDLLPLFSALSTDEQDSVRLMGVENCAAMGKLLSQADNRAVLLPVIRAVAQDKSWRVRYVVAEHICELLPHVGPEARRPPPTPPLTPPPHALTPTLTLHQVTRDEMLPAFLGMMHDTEAEVRTAAAFKVTAFSELLPAGLAEGLVLPCVRDVCSDKSQHVRAALASVIMGLAPVVGKPVTIEKLLPLFLQLLKDEFPEVRLNLIATLHALNAVVGVDLLAQSLLPAIAELAEDRQWRVRLAIIEYIPLLAAQLGASFFDEKLSVMCLGWLQDCVHTIREAATLNLQKLAQLFGPEWAQKHLLPHVLAPHTHTNYLYRLTALYAATGFAAVVSHDALLTSILPLVLQMTADPVPNVSCPPSRRHHFPLPHPHTLATNPRPCRRPWPPPRPPVLMPPLLSRCASTRPRLCSSCCRSSTPPSSNSRSSRACSASPRTATRMSVTSQARGCRPARGCSPAERQAAPARRRGAHKGG